MTLCLFFDCRRFTLLCGFLFFVMASGCVQGQAAPAAIAAFQSYAGTVEARLVRQHGSRNAFLAPVTWDRLRRGELIVERITPPSGMASPGALLHHWRGTAFVAGASADEFERLLKDFNDYPHDFAPEVREARVLSQNGDRVQAWMRVRQQHVITVVMDTTYDVTFGELDAKRRFSNSRSIRISEMGSDGRALRADEEHGFLWRLNTYWSYEERDGGLFLQIEAVSLTRSIPYGLGWAVRPFVESVPRESLEFTLRSACSALRSEQDGGGK